MRTLKFEELNISTATLDTLKSKNIEEATPLQQSIVSHLKNEQDLLIRAEAGEEKYTAYAVITREVLEQGEAEKPTVLILTSSPDAARSIREQLISFGAPADGCACIDDDGDKGQQAEIIEAEPAVIIANPGRLQTLLQEHRYIFRHIALVILDELDNMVNGDQSGNLKRIKRRVLSDAQMVACADNYDGTVKKAASGFADDPVITGFDVSDGGDTPPSIPASLKQGYINVPYRMKISTLMAHLEQTPSDNCVVFTASKRGTDRLYRVLKKRGMKATSLHGKLSDDKRAQRFTNFTSGDVQFLLVADISAAELDLHDVRQVINYDVPNSSDEYRFRTGLLGSGKGTRIVSLVSKQDRSDINELQNELGQTPDEIPLPDEVKQKLKERKNKKSNGQKKERGKGKEKRQQRQKKNEMELPRPSYDKLSGGRSGDHDEKKTGFVKFFKKLFS